MSVRFSAPTSIHSLTMSDMVLEDVTELYDHAKRAKIIT
jgi:hypothetical protein